ncbi:ROK family transcriptional regulator [Paramylibacter kogurei]|uniref:ROK family transcriptional regulator n=1 Tax=Paramylibacter kogurei TaxID=1889778 RepID=UPI0013FDB829|nr:ROK family transcriptional regulator [Amylibacter kogurei]
MSFIQTAITTEGLRHNNRAMVLNSLREFGPLSHTVIAEKTGLASGTVSVITGEFLEEGVLEKVEQAPASGRGRPRISFIPCAEFAYFVMLRISAERIEYSLLDYRNTLKDRQVFGRDNTQTDAILFGHMIKKQLADFVARSAIKKNQIKVISVTTKGEVDTQEQSLLWSPVFGNQKINFRKLLSDDWTAEVKLHNEICFVAHNVMKRAVQNGSVSAGDRHAVVWLSDNIGLGVARVNQHKEIELSAPSFGHMPHIAQGPLCRCGANGCLETYAGFYGILRTAFEAPTDVIPANFIPLDQMHKLAQSARSGDRMTEFAFRQAGTALGLSLSRLFNVLGPMPLTIVGAGLQFYDLLKHGLEKQLQDSFLVRMGQAPNVSFEPNEDRLAFDSNSFVTLREYDKTEVATRKFKRSKK